MVCALYDDISSIVTSKSQNIDVQCCSHLPIQAAHICCVCLLEGPNCEVLNPDWIGRVWPELLSSFVWNISSEFNIFKYMTFRMIE